MVRRICDRCGKVMKGPENDGVSHVMGCVIVQTHSGHIVERDWNALDLCTECRDSFAEWLGVNKGGASCAYSSATDAEGSVQHG